MIQERLKKLKDEFKYFGIDGYVIPKNDEFFGEYSKRNRLKMISNFSGSAGFAVILKKKNYLFVDGRYSIQANIEAGKYFKIKSYDKIINCKLFKNLILGIDPKIFTKNQIEKFFNKYNKTRVIDENLIDKVSYKTKLISKPFYSLPKNVVGENYFSKIKKVSEIIKKKKSNYLFVSAPENVAWLLNIRGFDSPNSPIPNCRLFLSKNKKIYLISEKNKTYKLIKEKKIKEKNVIEPKDFGRFIEKLKKGKIIIDKNTCSLFFENLLKKKLKILNINDPIFHLKSIKNKIEIANMIKSHIYDGAALTKFLYWIKKTNKNKITELDAQKKLEKFRKKNENYLFPSFNTIAGAGKNGAIIHYKATKNSNRLINKKDIFLCDSGGQYKYGTTDVTRTICFSKPKPEIKDIYTRVLKGHIAVANTNLENCFNGKLIDSRARKYLKNIGLDYAHGTGHGVGFFSNVHEGPQSISKYNKVKIIEGMILSNEPGYYKKDKFGIRIENLLYVKKLGKKIMFDNLTMAPIEKDLIDFNKLNNNEKRYLFLYHLKVYTVLSNYLSKNERKWLATFI